MLHKPFRQLDDLLECCDTFKDAFGTFLRSSSVPASVADDLHQLEMAQTDDRCDADTVNEVSNIEKVNRWYIFDKNIPFQIQ